LQQFFDSLLWKNEANDGFGQKPQRHNLIEAEALEDKRRELALGIEVLLLAPEDAEVDDPLALGIRERLGREGGGKPVCVAELVLSFLR